MSKCVLLLSAVAVLIATADAQEATDEEAMLLSEKNSTDSPEDPFYGMLTPEEREKFRATLRQLSKIGDVLLTGKISGADPPPFIEVPGKDENETMVVPNNVFEGDIVLNSVQMDEILNSAKESAGIEEGFESDIIRKKRANIAKNNGAATKWPRTIRYRIDRGTGLNPRWPREAIGLWEAGTCLRFQEIFTKTGDYMNFIKGKGCWAGVGHTSGSQSISIGPGCESNGIAAHELGHMLGFWHEHSRADRDSHIRLATDNITPGTMGNFIKRHSGNSIWPGPFDFGSVMHYGPTAFAVNYAKWSIVSKDARFQNTMGQRSELSFYDVKAINDIYCADICRNTLPCKNSGYPDPKNCNVCRCPSGLGGRLCEKALSTGKNCGQIDLTATTNWQTLRSSGFNDCNWLIKAPGGGKVVMEVDQFQFNHQETCIEEYLEIKFKRDLGNTGARFCRQPAPRRIVSDADAAVVRFRGRIRGRLTLRYRREGGSGGVSPVTQPTRRTTPRRTTPVPTPDPISTTRRPPVAFWASWGPWSACTQSCGGCGVQQRIRSCFGGGCQQSVAGSNFDYKRCNFNICPNVQLQSDPVYGVIFHNRSHSGGIYMRKQCFSMKTTCTYKVRVPCDNPQSFCSGTVELPCDAFGDGVPQETVFLLTDRPHNFVPDVVSNDPPRDGCCAPYGRQGNVCVKGVVPMMTTTEMPTMKTTQMPMTTMPTNGGVGWGTWSRWSACQLGGVKYRGRKCRSVTPCLGTQYEMSSCFRHDPRPIGGVPQTLKEWILKQSV